MPTMTIRRFLLTLALTCVPCAAAAQQGHEHAGHAAHHPPQAQQPKPDSAFAALQARGGQAMGVDQYTSTHRFDALPDGGRIELQRDTDDAEGVATIRAHLRSIADAFARGDFATPAFVHAGTVPGTEVMAARRAAIRYEYRDLPRGGELRIVTADAEAVRAIHAFMAFQRGDHRAGGIHP
jgi:predicted lipid-binding transport protein (Tim44 family)